MQGAIRYLFYTYELRFYFTIDTSSPKTLSIAWLLLLWWSKNRCCYNSPHVENIQNWSFVVSSPSFSSEQQQKVPWLWLFTSLFIALRIKEWSAGGRMTEKGSLHSCNRGGRILTFIGKRFHKEVIQDRESSEPD